MAAQPSFVVIGAGAIGTFVGALLDNAGFRVRFLQRESSSGLALRQVLSENGLVALCSTDPAFRACIPAERIADVFTTDPSCLTQCSHVLVAAKRTSNADVAKQLTDHGVTGPVVFLQNGVGIWRDLGSAAFDVIEAMVSFNVVFDLQTGIAILSQDLVESQIVLDGKVSGSAALAHSLACLPLSISAVDPLLPVQVGKLLLNMTNAVNALSGRAILPMFEQRDYRLVLAASIAEAQQVFEAAGISPVGVTKQDDLMLRIATNVFRSPDWFFMAALGRKLKGRGGGFTSMAQDLMARRVPTEISFLNGEVSRQGKELGLATPVNDALIALVRQAETRNQGCPNLAPGELLESVGVEDALSNWLPFDIAPAAAALATLAILRTRTSAL